MSTPLVSVIVPAYRHERFVAAAIESVLTQSLEDWELIVIDDCSPDATWQKIKSFDDTRMVALKHQANRGAHVTVNEGLTHARGRYLAILNSDDVYHPERLQRTVTFLEEGGADFVGTDVDLIDGEGRIVESDHPWLDWFERRKKSIRESGDVVDALLAGNLYVTTSNFVLRRAAFERIGGFANLRYAHDYEFLLRASLGEGMRLEFLDREKLLSYRMHGANTVVESFLEVHRETFSLLCKWVPRAFPQQCWQRGGIALRHMKDIESFIEYELNQSISTRDEKARNLESELSGLDQRIEGLATELSDRDQRIEGLATELSDRDQRIEGLATELSDRDQRIEGLATELADRKNAMDTMIRSRSWRMTEPLRAAARFLRGERKLRDIVE